MIEQSLSYAKRIQQNYTQVKEKQKNINQAKKKNDRPISIRTGKKIGRNEPCHCVSGKKAKKMLPKNTRWLNQVSRLLWQL
jgi:uncharacterized protein YecA (UPF0149 family)